MHMVSKKDVNSAELETMRTSRSPTTHSSKFCFLKKLSQL